MNKIYINHFVYGDFKRQPSQLSSEEVGKFYDNFVPVSVDVVPMIVEPTGKKVLLGLRREEPKTWWTIGRGMVPGEAPSETASRALYEEFGINAEINIFNFVCINSSVFALRRQLPEKNGRQCLTLVFSLEVKPEEMNYFVFQSEKYHEVRWILQSEAINNESFDLNIRAAISQL